MIEYFNEDCLIGMARYPDKHFDLAIVDPPYGIGASNKAFMRKGKQTGKSLAVSGVSYSEKRWDNSTPTSDYFNELTRVSKDQIIWGGNYFAESLKNSSCWIVWDKQTGENLYADCELAWTSFNTAVRKFEFMWKGMFQGDMKNKEIRIHPTQKPVALYKWLLTNYAKPGDKILDTHVGSASSLVACHDLGFDAVGFELDEDYYNESKQRLERFMKQITLFDISELER